MVIAHAVVTDPNLILADELFDAAAANDALSAFRAGRTLHRKRRTLGFLEQRCLRDRGRYTGARGVAPYCISIICVGGRVLDEVTPVAIADV